MYHGRMLQNRAAQADKCASLDGPGGKYRSVMQRGGHQAKLLLCVYQTGCHISRLGLYAVVPDVRAMVMVCVAWERGGEKLVWRCAKGRRRRVLTTSGCVAARQATGGRTRSHRGGCHPGVRGGQTQGTSWARWQLRPAGMVAVQLQFGSVLM
jgi:hypothetical protein